MATASLKADIKLIFFFFFFFQNIYFGGWGMVAVPM